MDEDVGHGNVHARPQASERQAPGMPRWVKVSLLAIAVLAALFLLLHLTGLTPQHGGGHNMQGHGPMGLDFRALGTWS